MAKRLAVRCSLFAHKVRSLLKLVWSALDVCRQLDLSSAPLSLVLSLHSWHHVRVYPAVLDSACYHCSGLPSGTRPREEAVNHHPLRLRRIWIQTIHLVRSCGLLPGCEHPRLELRRSVDISLSVSPHLVFKGAPPLQSSVRRMQNLSR